MQGFYHQVPKTLAIVDLEKYQTFSESWNAFSKELLDLMNRGDPEVLIALNRARQSAYAFTSVEDYAGSKTPSSVDMMSFMFFVICALRELPSKICLCVDLLSRVS